MKFCTNCGGEVTSELQFCPSCGEQIVTAVKSGVEHVKEEIHEAVSEHHETMAVGATTAENFVSTGIPEEVEEDESNDKQSMWVWISWVCVLIGTFVPFFDFIGIVLAIIGYTKAESKTGKNAAIIAAIFAAFWLIKDLLF
ncbi:hypothetical protein EQG49_09070 [Periweissella cryptocerci]|uniref:Zinc-ribbon domain-containing protein n=1 Tax=Periweissella cryptocerci TaxID=2506420 RepID=A0A4P6YV55_9LACO|nr:hypothetical protein [Periweissella cryptocerci]QBO36613.1 hypothetical protein EQG49_09070 [Periweissella cryptocerci]